MNQAERTVDPTGKPIADGDHDRTPPTLADQLKSLPLYPLPHHAISRLVHRLMRIRGAWFRRPFTRWFVKRFRVDMREALEPDPLAYASFNSFFTRALHPEARPLPDAAEAVCSPADGEISAWGAVRDGQIIQAKGHRYTLRSLLASAEGDDDGLDGGQFMTVYLSPRDYHRVHMPLDGELIEMRHVPGRLFSVGRHTVRTIPAVFSRNERVVCLFQGAAGRFAVVLVGAINVGSIETAWAGEITPPRGHRVQRWTYGPGAPRLARGDELGRFNMGSTAIVVFAPGLVELDPAQRCGDKVLVRQTIGRLATASV